MTSEVAADAAWAALADLDEQARLQAMRARFAEIAGLEDEERLTRLRAMIAAEYSLPEDRLRELTGSRLRCWVELGRVDLERARRLGAGYDRVFQELPASLAMKRAAAVQTAVSHHFAPADVELLFEVIPGLGRQIPRRRSEQPRDTRANRRHVSFWRRLTGAR